MIALLLLAPLAACGADPEPPRRVKAPEPVKSPAKVSEQAQTPKPPPPPIETEKKPETPAAAVNKVLFDPSLPEWVGQAPAEFKAKFTTSKGDFTILVTREWSPRGADRFYGLVKNGFYD